MTVIRETTSIKLDKETKQEAKKIFSELGISMGDAVNMFLKQVTLTKSIPFEIKIPNDETIKAIEEARSGENLEEVSFDELIKKNA